MTTATKTPRSILITGTSTGIGEACALDLDQRGFRVFAGVRKEEDAARIKSQASELLSPVFIDVTDPESVSAAAATVGEAVGEAGLYALVNNAGVIVAGPLECVPIAEVRRQFEVNVLGQLAVTQAMLPLLRTAKGRIINMGSISGKVAPPFMGPYSASKFALESITDVLRLELRRWEIEVTIIEPDSVSTPIWNKLRDSSFEMGKHLPRPVRKLYKDELSAMWQATSTMEQEGMSVAHVVETVRRAITAGRPKTRYPVGFRTKLACWAACHLPDRIRDGFIRRAMGLRSK